MKDFLIAPSILSADFARLGEDVEKVLAAGADVVHFDVKHYLTRYLRSYAGKPVLPNASRYCSQKRP